METNKKLILYSGQDKNYWEQIKDRYRTSYSHLNFEFVEVYNSDPDSYQQTFLEILKLKPLIIYLDYSENVRTQKKLCLMLKRISNFMDTPVVALLENKEELRGAWASRADILAIKCAEYHDLIYHALFLNNPKSVVKPDFAKAKVNLDSQIVYDLRVGYITEGVLHAEGDLDVSLGQLLELETSIPSDCNKSKFFKVQNIERVNHYYDFDFSYDLELTYVDEPDYHSVDVQIGECSDDPKLVKELEEKKETLKNEFEHLLKNTKKKQKDWVLDSMDKSLAKSTKVLIVDPHLTFLSYESIPIDQHPYTIRIQTIFNENLSTIDKVMPNLIAVQVDDTSDKSAQASVDELSKLVVKIKAMAEYDPFIILFKSGKITSRACQENFQYQNMIAYKEEIILETVLKLAEMYEDRQVQKEDAELEAEILELRKIDPKTYGRLTKEDFKDKKYFIKKTSDLSYANFREDIKIITVTESELTFSSEKELKLTNYRLENPFNMFIKLVPIDDKPFVKESGKNIYKALIHGLDENDKKQLRRIVNEVYTEDVSAKEEEEKQQFFELNQEQLQQMQEKEAAAKEAKEKAKLEAEEFEASSNKQEEIEENKTE